MCFRRAMHGGVSGGGGGGRDHIKDPLEVGECDSNDFLCSFLSMFSIFFSELGFRRTLDVQENANIMSLLYLTTLADFTITRTQSYQSFSITLHKFVYWDR